MSAEEELSREEETAAGADLMTEESAIFTACPFVIRARKNAGKDEKERGATDQEAREREREVT